MENVKKGMIQIVFNTRSSIHKENKNNTVALFIAKLSSYLSQTVYTAVTHYTQHTRFAACGLSGFYC